MEIDEEAVRALEGHEWKSPHLFHEDGSVADW
jgi:hypothetical protein